MIVLMLVLSSTLVALGMAGDVRAGWRSLAGSQNGYYYYGDSCTQNCQLNVNLSYGKTGPVIVLIQVCKDFTCNFGVVSHETVKLTKGTIVRTYILTTPPSTFYVRITGFQILGQIRQVTFGASPQTITVVIS